MHKKDCFYLGKIVKKHSFKGEVVIKLDTDEPELYREMESVFVEIGNHLIPFFIKKSLLQKGNQLRVSFEKIDSEEDANTILKANVYLPLHLLPKLSGKQFYFHEVIGFEVKDVHLGNLGSITGINDTSAQALFEIEDKTTKILVPIVDEFIVTIDRENKQLILKTPEGLVDIYR